MSKKPQLVGAEVDGRFMLAMYSRDGEREYGYTLNKKRMKPDTDMPVLVSLDSEEARQLAEGLLAFADTAEKPEPSPAEKSDVEAQDEV